MSEVKLGFDTRRDVRIVTIGRLECLLEDRLCSRVFPELRVERRELSRVRYVV